MLEVTQMETRFQSSRYFFRFKRSFSEDLSVKCQKSYFQCQITLYNNSGSDRIRKKILKQMLLRKINHDYFQENNILESG